MCGIADKTGVIMKKVAPIGYSKTSVGTGFSIFIIIIAIVIMTLLVKGGASASDAKYLVIGGVVLAAFFGLSDLTTNLKNQKKISHMNDMLECPAVKGEIKEIKRFGHVLGKEIEVQDNKRYNHYVYRIIAAFHDTESDSEKMVTSEPYARDPRAFISGNSVSVHYSPDGEYWIEPGEWYDGTNDDGNTSKKVRALRFSERHGALVTFITMAVSILTLVTAYFIVTNIFS